MSTQVCENQARKEIEITRDNECATINEQQKSLNHDELVKLTRIAIANVIESDPLLSSDLPADPTPDEIRAQKAVAQGQAITLYLDRGLLPKLSIVVSWKRTYHCFTFSGYLSSMTLF